METTKNTIESNYFSKSEIQYVIGSLQACFQNDFGYGLIDPNIHKHNNLFAVLMDFFDKFLTNEGYYMEFDQQIDFLFGMSQNMTDDIYYKLCSKPAGIQLLKILVFINYTYANNNQLMLQNLNGEQLLYLSDFCDFNFDLIQKVSDLYINEGIKFNSKHQEIEQKVLLIYNLLKKSIN